MGGCSAVPGFQARGPGSRGGVKHFARQLGTLHSTVSTATGTCMIPVSVARPGRVHPRRGRGGLRRAESCGPCADYRRLRVTAARSRATRAPGLIRRRSRARTWTPVCVVAGQWHDSGPGLRKRPASSVGSRAAGTVVYGLLADYLRTVIMADRRAVVRGRASRCAAPWPRSWPMTPLQSTHGPGRPRAAPPGVGIGAAGAAGPDGTELPQWVGVAQPVKVGIGLAALPAQATAGLVPAGSTGWPSG